MITPPRRMASGERLSAARYNELLDYVRRATPVAGRNISVDYTLSGSRISGLVSASESGPKPFAVRHHSDQWEIYLPTGCCTLGQTCAPINPTAEAANADHAGEDGWYAFPFDEDEGQGETGEDGTTVRRFEIVIHVKPFAKISGTDPLDDTPRRMMLAAAHKTAATGESVTDERRYRYFEGDHASFTVAEVAVYASGTDKTRKITQLRDSPFEIAAPAASAFDLQWYFKASSDGISVEKVYCTRALVNAAGIQLGDASTGGGEETMTDVTDAASTIHARISTDPLGASAAGSVAVVKDATGHTVRTDHLTWLLLYTMKCNCVLADYRASALANVQIWR